jgi:hypothetical protein
LACREEKEENYDNHKDKRGNKCTRGSMIMGRRIVKRRWYRKATKKGNKIKREERRGECVFAVVIMIMMMTVMIMLVLMLTKTQTMEEGERGRRRRGGKGRKKKGRRRSPTCLCLFLINSSIVDTN